MTFPSPEPHAEPLELFQAWFLAASSAGIFMPEAMALATASHAEGPAARMVLLKGFTPKGHLRFFTHYDSPKGQQLAADPRAALLFWWGPVARQVRVEGEVYRLSDAESDAYFASRPRLSQLSAAVSPQSRPIGGHAELLDRSDALAARLGDAPVPRPPHWGGYAVAPSRWEFWIGHDGRLHERYAYTRRGAGWDFTPLAP